MNKLENYFIKTAEIFLNKQEGEFYPFSAAENNSNEIQMITPHSENDNPESLFLIEQYREYGNNQIIGNKIKKCGICYDVNLKFESEITNAIQIEFLIFKNGEIETEKRTYLYEKQNGIYKIRKTAHNNG